MPYNTNQNMLNELVSVYGYSLVDIAHHIGVNKRTVFRIRKGQIPSIRTEINLMNFYCFTTISETSSL